MDTITTLHASTVISDFQWHKMSPQEIEDYVRQELAQQLVDAIINEDLIKIYTERFIYKCSYYANAT